MAEHCNEFCKAYVLVVENMIATQQNINGWILEKTLGSGGFGAVYLFRHDVI